MLFLQREKLVKWQPPPPPPPPQELELLGFQRAMISVVKEQPQLHDAGMDDVDKG